MFRFITGASHHHFSIPNPGKYLKHPAPDLQGETCLNQRDFDKRMGTNEYRLILSQIRLSPFVCLYRDPVSPLAKMPAHISRAFPGRIQKLPCNCLPALRQLLTSRS